MTLYVRVLDEDNTANLDDVILEATAYNTLHFILYPNICVFIRRRPIRDLLLANDRKLDSA